MHDMTADEENNLETSVARSMDAPPVLFRYLPYLLQDIHELGVRTSDILQLFDELDIGPDQTVLDVGCGKSPALPLLAQRYGCRGRGIDAVPAFIAEAEKHADAQGMSEQVTFEVGDIEELTTASPESDVVMYFAMGELLGPLHVTLKRLASLVGETGVICFDEAYVSDAAVEQSEDELEPFSRTSVVEEIEAAGFTVVAEHVVNTTDEHHWYRESTARVLERAKELAANADFEVAKEIMSFANRQVEDADLLDGGMCSALWAVRKSQ